MPTLKEIVFCAARDGKAISLFATLYHREHKEVKEVLNHQTEEEGQKTTPFLISARNGHEKVIRLLLQHFNVNIEQTGTVRFDGYVIDGATALWCAAGAGHLNVVRTLLEFGADVNHATFTNSTPLRAACFDGRLDIVKCLIKFNANIQIANKYDNTCLMIACYKGHKDVVSYLLSKGANPDAKARCGATALHFSAECGHYDIVQELLRYKSTIIKNDHGMTPLHIAAESSRAEIVELFISRPECSKEDRIEALELLGASYANDKDNYDLDKAYHYMWLAMQERYSDSSNVLMKNVKSPNPAYENRIECKSVAELEMLKDDADSLHMEALVMRERILGENNPEIPHPVIFRGAVFADTAQFDRCTALWMHAMKLRFKNDRTIFKDLLRFAQVFSQMIHVGVELEYSLAVEVFSFALKEIERDRKRIEMSNQDDLSNSMENCTLYDIYDCNVYVVLYLLVLLTKVKCDETEELHICKMVYQLIRMNPKLSKTNDSLLHMAIDEKTHVDDFHVNDVVKFPNAIVTKLLVKCGAKVDALNNVSNTPLHVIVKYNKPISDFLTLHSIIMTLVESGAHLDMANEKGLTPLDVATTGVSEIILKTQRRISLKCLAARAVKKHKLSYAGQIPTTLEEFIQIH